MREKVSQQDLDSAGNSRTLRDSHTFESGSAVVLFAVSTRQRCSRPHLPVLADRHDPAGEYGGTLVGRIAFQPKHTHAVVIIVDHSAPCRLPDQLIMRRLDQLGGFLDDLPSNDRTAKLGQQNWTRLKYFLSMAKPGFRRVREWVLGLAGRSGRRAAMNPAQQRRGLGSDPPRELPTRL